jgi:hypothetical protein
MHISASERHTQVRLRPVRLGGEADRRGVDAGRLLDGLCECPSRLTAPRSRRRNEDGG